MAALEMVLNQVFRTGNGDRPSVPNVAVVVGASPADRRLDEVGPMHVAIRNAGIRLLAIGVTQHEPPTAEQVTTARAMGSLIYLVDRFHDLGSVMDEVVGDACREAGEHSLVDYTSE